MKRLYIYFFNNVVCLNKYIKSNYLHKIDFVIPIFIYTIG